jgi:hypothetical protein
MFALTGTGQVGGVRGHRETICDRRDTDRNLANDPSASAAMAAKQDCRLGQRTPTRHQ